MLVDLLDSLDTLELPAPVYRSAVRMARQAGGSGMLTLTYAQARAVCGTESDATVRSHLHQLHAAGVLWFRRNEVIRVGFYAPDVPLAVLAQRAQRASSAQNVEPANTDADDERALSARNVGPANTNDEDAEDGRALSARNVEPANTTRAERAKRAASQQYKVGRKVGREVRETPTYLPGGSGGDSGLTPEEARTVALLTDPDFGMDTPTASKLAQQYPFEQVRAHAFAVLAELRSGKGGVRSVYVLASRLQRGGYPQVLPSDRESGLWKRHCSAEDAVDADGTTAEERRRKYIPPEYEGIIIG